MTVRSLALSRYRLPTASNWNVAVCPPDVTLLAKSAAIHNRAAVAQTIQLLAQNASGSMAVALITANLQPNTSSTWAGWQVLMPGDLLIISTSAGPTDVWVSGALLYGVALGYTQPLNAQQLPAIPESPFAELQELEGAADRLM